MKLIVGHQFTKTVRARFFSENFRKLSKQLFQNTAAKLFVNKHLTKHVYDVCNWDHQKDRNFWSFVIFKELCKMSSTVIAPVLYSVISIIISCKPFPQNESTYYSSETITVDHKLNLIK